MTNKNYTQKQIEKLAYLYLTMYGCLNEENYTGEQWSKMIKECIADGYFLKDDNFLNLASAWI